MKPKCTYIYRSGLQNRKNSFQDGVSGTNCPIPPGKNYTYKLQMKDQIGSLYYFPSLGFQKAAGGFGAIKILSRPKIPVPFPPPSADYSILIGDWYKTDYQVLYFFISFFPIYFIFEVLGKKINNNKKIYLT